MKSDDDDDMQNVRRGKRGGPRCVPGRTSRNFPAFPGFSLPRRKAFAVEGADSKRVGNERARASRGTRSKKKFWKMFYLNKKPFHYFFSFFFCRAKGMVRPGPGTGPPDEQGKSDKLFTTSREMFSGPRRQFSFPGLLGLAANFSIPLHSTAAPSPPPSCRDPAHARTRFEMQRAKVGQKSRGSKSSRLRMLNVLVRQPFFRISPVSAFPKVEELAFWCLQVGLRQRVR